MEFLRVDWVILKEKIVLSLTCFSGGQWRRETWILPYSLPTPTTSLKLEVKFLHQSRWKIQIAPHYCYFGFNNIERESDSSHLPFLFHLLNIFFFPLLDAHHFPLWHSQYFTHLCIWLWLCFLFVFVVVVVFLSWLGWLNLYPSKFSPTPRHTLFFCLLLSWSSSQG